MIRPTRRLLRLTLALVLPAFVLPILRPELWFLGLLPWALLLLAMAFDAVLLLPKRWLAVQLKGPPLLFVGDTTGLELQLEPNLWRGRVPWLDWRLPAVEGLGLETEGSTNMRQPQAQTQALPCSGKKRGIWTLKQVWLAWPGPLGLVMRHAAYDLDFSLPVVPSIRAAQSGMLALQKLSSTLGQKEQRERGQGSDFDSLVEYSAGMDHRLIDWKRSAAHRKLLAKELTAERNHQVILAFDTGYLMVRESEGLSRLDRAINAGLAVGWLALASGDLVGLYSYAERPGQFRAPRRGTSSFAGLRHACSELAYGKAETNTTLGLVQLAGQLKRRSLIILFTDFADSTSAELLVENLGILSRKHLLAFVSLRDDLLEREVNRAPENMGAMASALAASDLVQERALVLDRLRRLGVFVLDVRANQLTAAVLNTYLSIRERSLQ